MKKINLQLIIAVFTLLNILSSCSIKDEPITEHPFHEIKEHATFHGNFESNIVVINTQGGPETKLEDNVLRDIMNTTNTYNALFVNVHQKQTKEPHLFSKADITFEEAKQYDIESVVRLKNVIDYYKKKNKKVCVLGISFGAFMTQELIAEYGIDIADKYLIIAGRLDIEKETWSPFSEGKMTEYIYNQSGDFSISIIDKELSTEEKNMAKLAAGLGFNRYTKRLKAIEDLSKITYIYGTRDEQVGPLSDEEIKFLESKKVQIGKNDGANHDQTIQAGASLIKALFGI